MILALALKSLRHRKLSVALTVLSIALSVLLLLGVERVRNEARSSFTATVSGTDLIVGARSSPVHLLLYSVFHVGNATNNVRWETYRALASRSDVAWAIPLSLGDSYRGYRVVGTTAGFFEHYRYADNRDLRFGQGQAFSGGREAVIGADVARQLHYKVGDTIVLAHGAGDVSFIRHDDHPFRIAGVLVRTGTPVDRAVHVDLGGIAALHQEATKPVDPLLDALHGHDALAPRDEHDGAATAITSILMGLKTRQSALAVQRAINEYKDEPLTALLPGVTLQEVWEILGAMEKTLLAVSALVVLVGLAGMLVALLTSLNERRREMAVLRALGARPAHIFALILGEACMLTLAGLLLGMIALQAGLLLGRSWLEARLGLFIPLRWPTLQELGLMATVAVAGVLIGLVPAYRTYRHSLADGMTVRA